MMTLHDAVKQLDAGNLPYSKSNALKVRGSANKCVKLSAYNCDLTRIPVDSDAFSKRWKKNISNKDAPHGFKTFASFATWHSNVKSLMDHVSGQRERRDSLRAQIDDWTRIEECVDQLIKGGKHGTGIRHEQLIALRILRAKSREEGRQPKELTKELILFWMLNSQQSQKTAMRRAAALLDKLHEYSDAVNPSLLPAPIGEIPKATKQRQTPVFPDRVAESKAAYLAGLKQGRPLPGLLKNMRGKPLSEGAIQCDTDGIHWFYSCLIEQGLIAEGANPAPEKLLTLENIQMAFEAEIDGDYYWTPLKERTVKKYLAGTFRYAKSVNPSIGLAQNAFFKQEYFLNWSAMTEQNEAFCRALVQSPKRTATFLNLAKIFFDLAEPMIADFKNLSPSKKHIAIDYAMAAASAAILTFLPLRGHTLVQLQCVGENAHIFLPQDTKTVTLAVPSDIVKNGRKIVTTLKRRGAVDPRGILEWWLGSARQRMMKRLQNPNQDLLFGGADTERFRKSWRFSTASVNLYMNPHQVRHAIASILVNQPNSDIDTIAALLGDAPETVRRSYSFFDREEALQRGMNQLEDISRALVKGGQK